MNIFSSPESRLQKEIVAELREKKVSSSSILEKLNKSGLSVTARVDIFVAAFKETLGKDIDHPSLMLSSVKKYVESKLKKEAEYLGAKADFELEEPPPEDRFKDVNLNEYTGKVSDDVIKELNEVLRKEADLLLKESEAFSKHPSRAKLYAIQRRIEALPTRIYLPSSKVIHRTLLFRIQRISQNLTALVKAWDAGTEPSAKELQFLNEQIKRIFFPLVDDRPNADDRIKARMFTAIRNADLAQIRSIVSTFKSDKLPWNLVWSDIWYINHIDPRIFRELHDNGWDYTEDAILYLIWSVPSASSKEVGNQLKEMKQRWEDLRELNLDLNDFVSNEAYSKADDYSRPFFLMECVPIEVWGNCYYPSSFVFQEFIDNGLIVNVDKGYCPYLITRFPSKDSHELYPHEILEVFLFNGAVPPPAAEKQMLEDPYLREVLSIRDEALRRMTPDIKNLKEVEALRNTPDDVLRIAAGYTLTLDEISRNPELRTEFLKLCRDIQAKRRAKSSAEGAQSPGG